jgi:hypothetical protein
MEGISKFTEALMRVSNLDINQAKTLVYYTIITWSEKLKIRPLIDLHGESSSGKNSIMKQIESWCRGAKWINASNKTPAQLRDDLNGVVTAFIEEADKTKDPKECETWYQQRYENTGNGITFKVLEKTEKGHVIPKEVKGNFFGNTIMHSQNSFVRVELDRRILRLNLIKDSSRLYTFTEGLEPKTLKEIAQAINWDMPIEQSASNSAWDVWVPLIRVATHLQDTAFIDYVKEQIKLKTEEDNQTKEYEPRGLVFSEIFTVCDNDPPQFPVNVSAKDIRKALMERGYQYDERQIVKNARELGFTIIRPHNKSKIKVESKEKLLEIAEKNKIPIESEN